MNDKFEPLSSDDVISTEEGILSYPTFQVEELLEALRADLARDSSNETILSGDLQGKVLSASGNRAGWLKGTIRLHMTLEFCPDMADVSTSPESNDLLGEFRQ